MDQAFREHFQVEVKRIARGEIKSRRDRGLPVRGELIERRTWRTIIFELIPDAAEGILSELKQPAPKGLVGGVA